MAAPKISVKLNNRWDESCAQRVEVDVAHQFKEIFLFVTDDRLVPVLEEMAGAAMPEVEGHCVTGQQSSHELCQRDLARPEE